MRFSKCLAAAIFAVVAAAVPPLGAQNAGQTTPGSTTQAQKGGNTPVPAAGAPAGAGQGTPGTVVAAPGARTRERPAAYPTRQVDTAAADRGKVLFGVSCSFCHGSDARGGEGGPNLIRSGLVLGDKSGETIAPVILNGRIDRGMPKFELSMAQISDVAAFLHSFKVGGYDISRKPPPSILVGDATTGKTTFQTMCGSCHSVTGDLKGFASKAEDPRALQQAWLMPSGGGRGMGPQIATHVQPTTVSVTLPSGEKVEGKLDRIDDFIVTFTDSDGYQRTITRHGDEPKVTINDPLEPHRKLLAEYTDKQIHDITAYLETIK